MPKRKNKTQKKDKTLIGFDNIPKTDKTIWATDQFGKRKVLDIEKYIIREHIDNGGLATDSTDLNYFLPGTDIPIYNEKKLYQDKPEYVIIFSWHIAKEIINMHIF